MYLSRVFAFQKPSLNFGENFLFFFVGSQYLLRVWAFETLKIRKMFQLVYFVLFSRCKKNIINENTKPTKERRYRYWSIFLSIVRYNKYRREYINYLLTNFTCSFDFTTDCILANKWRTILRAFLCLLKNYGLKIENEF